MAHPEEPAARGPGWRQNDVQAPRGQHALQMCHPFSDPLQGRRAGRSGHQRAAGRCKGRAVGAAGHEDAARRRRRRQVGVSRLVSVRRKTRVGEGADDEPCCGHLDSLQQLSLKRAKVRPVVAWLWHALLST